MATEITGDVNGQQGVSAAQNPAVTLFAENQGSLSLPDGFSLTQSDFSQSGSDLVLTGPDGGQIVIADYFTFDVPPDLVSANGATIGPELAGKLAGSQAPAQMAQATGTNSNVLGEAIGQVDTVFGSVTATRADGTKVELADGDAVYQGDVLQSGADGSIGIVLADESSFSMAENGTMTLDEMVYAPESQQGSLSISVVSAVHIRGVGRLHFPKRQNRQGRSRRHGRFDPGRHHRHPRHPGRRQLP